MMSHGINYNNGHIRSREAYTSVGKRDSLMKMMPYNNHNRFRLSHDNQVNKSIHPAAGQDRKSTTISEINNICYCLTKYCWSN